MTGPAVRRRLLATALALVWTVAPTAGLARQSADPLFAGFVSPPAEARPLVYWQWVNGNVTEDGIRLDLEWMRRIGLGGVLLMDVAFRTPPVPQYVDQRIGFGTPEWDSAVRFTAQEARRLDLSFGAQSSGGWSVSGGPDVPPEDGMKKLVWSETEVAAGVAGPIALAPPPSVSGPFQTVSIGELYREPVRSGEVAVIAYRLPDREQSATPAPDLGGVPESDLLADGEYGASVRLTPDAHGEAVVTAAFPTGRAPRAVTVGIQGSWPTGAVEARGEEGVWATHAVLPGVAQQGSPVRTFSLAPSPSTQWRVRFTDLTRPLDVSEIRFDQGARVNRVEDKAGFGVLTDYDAVATSAVEPAAAVAPDQVVDLSDRLRPDGSLDWSPTEGRWGVVRFGWSLTGRHDTPAPPESLGLEVDKLDASAVRRFAQAHYGRYERAIAGAGTFDLSVTDSWEAGQQTWTPEFLSSFAARRGYDARPWLPVITGRIVGDAARSDRFLADYRRTLADLLADNHYGVLAEFAHAAGRTLYAEAAGTDLPTVVDGLQAKGRVDVPMGEYWWYPEGAAPKPNHVADIREAASAAHVYGHRLTAAEALTSMGEEPWGQGPTQLRRIVDRFFTEGVNQMVLHTSAHQPFGPERRPGLTLRQYGQHFTRNETWAEDAGAWISYLARTSFLLRQGRPVADVLVFTGEGAANSPRFDVAGGLERPVGYDYDFIDAEALLTRVTVEDGRLVLPDGVSYRLLVLPAALKRMSLPLATRLTALVEAGAVVVGPRPEGAEGLANTDAEIEAVANVLWGDADTAPVRTVGAGRLYKSGAAVQVLDAEGVPADVASPGDAPLMWKHRRTDDADIYFLANQGTRPLVADVQFRVAGREAEIWDAVDGSRRAASYRFEKDATVVPIALAPWTSQFVVFRTPARTESRTVPAVARTTIETLDRAWTVAFRDGQGAPARTRFAALQSWTASDDPAIRYYSGRATYSRTLVLPRGALTTARASQARLELELGKVAEIARVRINGRDLGVLWTAPWSVDVTDALAEGDNTVEIDVVNYWSNRMIGDLQPGTAPVTFASLQPFVADTPLRPSGLFGPVRLVRVAPAEVVSPQLSGTSPAGRTRQTCVLRESQ